MNTQSDEESLMFGKEISETIVTARGNYKTAILKNNLPYVDSFFYEELSINPIISILGLLVAIVASVISVIPLASYEGFLPSIDWNFSCILRAATFGIVYLEAWISFFRNTYRRFQSGVTLENSLNFPGVPWIKQSCGFVFAFVYAGLYTWKWYVIPDIQIKYTSMILFQISTTNVFYNLILKQLSNSISGNLHNRQRKVLLKAAKIGYLNIIRNPRVTQTVVDYLRNNDCSKFSLMFGVHKDHIFQNTQGDVMNIYEEDFYDPFEYVRVSCVNICLGVICIALWMTMIEDYGYAISSTTKLSEEAYLWIVCITCFLISCFYVLCSYDLVHQVIRGIHNFLRCKNSIQLLKSFLIKFPAFVMGILISTTRMNSSYITFGRLAGKYGLPESVGFTLIYTGVGIVFGLDMITDTQLIHHAIRSLLLLVNWSCCSGCYYGRQLENRMIVQYYHIKAKNLIRDATDEILSRLTADIACRPNNLCDI